MEGMQIGIQAATPSTRQPCLAVPLAATSRCMFHNDDLRAEALRQAKLT